MKWGAMKVHRRRRLTLIALVLLAVGSTIGLTLRALTAISICFMHQTRLLAEKPPLIKE